MNIKIIKIMAIASLAFAMTNTAFAAAAGGYLGVDVGRSNLNNKNQVLETGGVPPTINTNATNTGAAIRLFAGANINPYAAVEFGFDHYASTTYGGVPSSLTTNNPSIHEYGFDFQGKGMVPVGAFSVFGKAGFAYVRSTASGSLATCATQPGRSASYPCSQTTGVHNSTQTNAFRPLVGFGTSYDLTQNWVADLSYTRILPGSGIQTISMVALGISYHFVDLYCGQFLC
jgi:opacity protein-like surface antigen